MTVLRKEKSSRVQLSAAAEQSSCSGQRETEIGFEEDAVGQMAEMAIHNNDHSVIPYSCGERGREA
jgi:hypothetical protein